MARTFSVVDARNGFWYVVVVEKSSNLTTFSRPQGKSQRAFGISLGPGTNGRSIERIICFPAYP